MDRERFCRVEELVVVANLGSLLIAGGALPTELSSDLTLLVVLPSLEAGGAVAVREIRSKDDTLLSSDEDGFAMVAERVDRGTLFALRFSMSVLLLTDCVAVSVLEGIPDRCGTGRRLDVGILDMFNGHRNEPRCCCYCETTENDGIRTIPNEQYKIDDIERNSKLANRGRSSKREKEELGPAVPCL